MEEKERLLRAEVDLCQPQFEGRDAPFNSSGSVLHKNQGLPTASQSNVSE